jgi:septal ring factor EnvC (AmiA/AmiB activator)
MTSTGKADTAEGELAALRALRDELPAGYAIGDDATVPLAVECATLRARLAEVERECERLSRLCNERWAKWKSAERKLAEVERDFQKARRNYLGEIERLSEKFTEATARVYSAEQTVKRLTGNLAEIVDVAERYGAEALSLQRNEMLVIARAALVKENGDG